MLLFSNVLALILCWTFVGATATSKADGSAAQQAFPAATALTGDKVNVLAAASFGYSHVIEILGLVQRLIDQGGFRSTVIFSSQFQTTLGERLQNVTKNYSRVSIQYILPSADDEGLKNQYKQLLDFLDQVGIFSIEFDDDPSLLRELITAGDAEFRQQYWQRLLDAHARDPFHVALCDIFCPSCFAFADMVGIPAVEAAVQGYPDYATVEHNGLWLPSCNRPGSCSLAARLKTLYDYYVRPHNFLMSVTTIRQLLREARTKISFPPNVTQWSWPVRSQYPAIDQRVIGTLLPPAYYRSDTVVVGPSWLALADTTLSTELQNFLDNATRPVVFVSFGSHVRLNRHETALVLRGIMSQKWQVIWKCNVAIANELLAEMEKSEKIDRSQLLLTAWAPQLGVLQHPNTQLFVTHAGMSSVMEATTSGVPIVCLPLFADQAYHCQQLEALGVAVGLDKWHLTSAKLRDAIDRVLLQPTYAKKAKLIAEYHQNAAGTRGSDRLAEFMQHLAKYGYQFMNIADDSFNSFTYWNIDYWACVVLVHVVVLWVLGRVVRSTKLLIV